MTLFNHPVEFYDYDHSFTSGEHPLVDGQVRFGVKQIFEDAGYELEGEWGHIEMWVHKGIDTEAAPEWPVAIENGMLYGMRMTVFCRDLVGGLDVATRWAQLETISKLSHVIEILEESPSLGSGVMLGWVQRPQLLGPA